MDFIFKKSQEKGNHILFNYSKKAFFERSVRYNLLVFYFLTLHLAYPLEHKKIPNELMQEGSFTTNPPIIVSAKMVATGKLEIQFKAPLDANILKYEYAVDGSPFWTNVEIISTPLPMNGANGTITIAPFSGQSSIRIRAIGSNLVYSSEPYFISKSPLASLP